MKRKEGYFLRQIAGQNIIISEEKMDFDAMVTLNETGAFLWEQMKEPTDPEQLVQALLREYDVDAQTARRDVEALTEKLKELDLIE